MRRLLLDTNVLVRFLLGEPARQARAAASLFQQCDEGALELALLPIVAAETAFVLTSFYEQSRADVVRVLLQVLDSRGIFCERREELRLALRYFGESKAHFVDCYLAAASGTAGRAVASFDRDFDRLGVARADPLDP